MEANDKRRAQASSRGLPRVGVIVKISIVEVCSQGEEEESVWDEKDWKTEDRMD